MGKALVIAFTIVVEAFFIKVLFFDTLFPLVPDGIGKVVLMAGIPLAFAVTDIFLFGKLFSGGNV